ncbi:hypothetical protein RB195_009449 [Necator americanus]|uniref:Chitin-binding type-2 domain-containing protein n=1 Tax=Necator americanus TaxID=51031 RepID=A0ABR1CUK8_NECAM
MHRQLLIAALFFVTPGLCQTPVIGGNCHLGTTDVQIGGKQTQFFLKCEATSDSPAGDGVWVVKSRAAAAAAPSAPATGGSSATAPMENTQPQQHPKLMRKQNAPNICEQDNDAREADACAVSATCLQASQDIPSSYLQCDQTSLRWVRKSCQDGFIFNFEQQTCIVPKRMNSLSLTVDATCSVMSASCQDSADCPPTFACKNNCCRLDVCPSSDKVLFTCTNAYQCRAGEICVFGGCCPQVQKKRKMRPKVEFAAVSVDLAVKGNDDPYSNNLEAMSTRSESTNDSAYSALTAEPASKEKTTKMPAAMPIDDCDLDTRVEDCSLSNPCPENCECLSGQCCKIKAKRCRNGLLPLSVPVFCKFTDECPIMSFCEQNVCCAIVSDQSNDNDTEKDTSVGLPAAASSSTPPPSPSPKKPSEGVAKPMESIATFEKIVQQYRQHVHLEVLRCILDSENSVDTAYSAPHRISVITWGDVVYRSCEKDLLSPINKRLGCLGQPASGLICTFSSCSNSNPCSVGTCNNGYCCTSGSLPSLSAVSVRKRKRRSLTTANSTSNEHEENDWPVGPPGYGFPEHLADLDAILVKATGDGSTCAGGFSSSLPCSASGECPPGLFCDPRLQQCCPLILPLIDANTSPQTVQAWKEEMDLGTKVKLPPARMKFSSRSRPCRTGTITSANAPCLPLSSSNCAGCPQSAASPPIIALPINACPGGGYPVGQCNSGYCSPGYSCVRNACCPAYSAPQAGIQFACPTGGLPVGGCINGACATGYSCIQNQCCLTPVTRNPFVCPNGNQAAGGCVNGQCGAGYTCQNGLCCLGTAGQAVRCLDGSEAIGACIPSCTGGACGNVQISYYCGTGYTCTTGNICCPISSCPNGGEPIGPPVNGLCPEGYNLQGNQCCSNVAAACPDGSAGTPAVNGLCPAGTTLTGTVCCPAASAALVDFTQQYASKSGTENTQVGTCETASMGIGPCTAAGCGVGYACDNDATNPQCCPVVNYRDVQYQIGPAVSGMCPVGYVAVYPQSSANADGTNDGVCVDLQTVPGLCAVAVQAGPCSNGQCSTGYTCNTYADICCPTTTAFSRIRPGQNKRPNAGRPLHSYMPPRPEACADGSIPAGACINGLCGVGHECQNGNCCPPINVESKLRSMCPNGETAASGCFPNGGCGSGFECVRSKNLCCPPGGNDIIPSSPHNSVRPIGARCFMDAECVGHSEGLSLCHAGVCQCSPIAYMQGIACVRRKFNLKMNDSPIVDDVKKTMSV